MVATGARVRALATLLTDGGWTQVTPPRLPRVAELSDGQQDRIRSLYDLLGGSPDHFPRIRPGGWDLAFETADGLLFVELDEEQHFNRYRAQTLDSTSDLGAGPPGDFTGVGAPRWRQRAFYDSVKDVLTGRRLARISVHDVLENHATLEALLRRPDREALASLLLLISSRSQEA